MGEDNTEVTSSTPLAVINKDQQPRLTRRGFLGLAGALGAKLFLDSFVPKQEAAKAVSEPVVLAYLPGEETQNPEELGSDENNSPNESLGEMPPQTQVNKGKEERLSLPDDIVPTERLDNLNIHIHQTDQVKLYIREKGLEEIPLLKAVKESVDRYKTNPNEPTPRVNIILMDSEFTTSQDTGKVPQQFQALYKACVNPKREKGAEGARAFISCQDQISPDNIRYRDFSIFMPVGGTSKPVWSDRLPDPIITRISRIGRIHPGFTLMHEFLHYRDPNSPITDEDLVDREALWSLLYAARQVLQTGDTSKYYLVFATPEGNIITKGQGNRMV
jgi:hypothetical protein